MIHVIASIRVRLGKRSDFLEIFKSNLPSVREEKGCIEYFPAIDIETGLASQTLDENVVTIIETWENVQALHDHLNAPHMFAYREKVKALVEEVSVKVLEEA